MKDIRAEAVEVIRITRVAGSGTEKDPDRKLGKRTAE